ncbi:MAG TPA: prephenate dehydrogenase/arogenate dehydrogenase family protein [Feifaniaceae bacterium]|nr:prephenate dehydrogenase/arogenate dehydrogenase family protein [Feifaniaceae bacterium]
MGFTVGIAGLGLIGGSAAKALRAYADCSIFGADADGETLDAALRESVLTGVLTEQTIAGCDWIFVALYPVDAVKWVEAHANFIKRGAVVIDLCGVKRNVCAGIAPLAKAHGFTYIGGHPMAGVARFGYFNSDKDLFRGASMLLTPEETPDAALRERLAALFRAMGFGFLKWTQPDEHDHMIAYTSQLAHVLSSAYAQSPSSARHIGFSAGSLRDMTRVATLNVDMWTELFLENREYLAEEVEALCARLSSYAKALREDDGDTVSSLLQKGCDAKRHMEEEEARYADGSHPDIQIL